MPPKKLPTKFEYGSSSHLSRGRGGRQPQGSFRGGRGGGGSRDHYPQQHGLAAGGVPTDEIAHGTSEFFQELAGKSQRFQPRPKAAEGAEQQSTGGLEQRRDRGDASSSQTQDTVLWLELGLCKSLTRAVAHLGFITPTPVQTKAIPPALNGRDVCMRAVTGSGKSAAFLLPLIHRLIVNAPRRQTDLRTERRYIRALILVPSRELGQQCMAMAKQFLAFTTGVEVALAIGGVSAQAQEAELQRSPELLVATPGRLCDVCRNYQGGRSRHSESASTTGHYHSQGLDLSGVETVVLDEADKLMTITLQPQVMDILKTFLPPPDKRQTIVCSATLTDDVDKFLKDNTNDSLAEVDVGHVALAAQLRQHFVRINVTEDAVAEQMAADRQAAAEAAAAAAAEEAKKRKPRRGRAPAPEVVPDTAVVDDVTSGLDALSVAYHTAVTKAKTAALVALCRSIVDRGVTGGVIIFTRFKTTAHRLTKLFGILEFAAAELQGELDQAARFAALAAFTSGTAKFLFSTDVASRGLDVDLISTVINYDLPPTLTAYIHRVGRTARIGRSGTAMSLVMERDDADIMRKILAVSQSINQQQVASVKRLDIPADQLADATAKVESSFPQLRAELAAEEIENKILEAERKLQRMSSTLVPLTLAERWRQLSDAQSQHHDALAEKLGKKRKRGGKEIVDRDAVIAAPGVSDVLTPRAKHSWCLSKSEKGERDKLAKAAYEHEAEVTLADVKKEMSAMDREEQHRLRYQKRDRLHQREKKERVKEREKDARRAERAKYADRVKKGTIKAIKAKKIRAAKKEKRVEARFKSGKKPLKKKTGRPAKRKARH